MTRPFEPQAYRAALGSFATGVTVITARAADGSPVGLTANSFNSVSLDPPMVLWSLAKQSRSLAAFRAAGHWAVHVLAADQGNLSDRFARPGIDKFAGLDIDANAHGVPLLAGCAARFECRSSFQYEGGDHLIFVGEVTAFDRAERPPLVFHAGRYARATQHDRTLPPARSARLAGGLGEDLLGYLLGRAHFQTHLGLRGLVREQGLSEAQWVLVAALTVQDGVSAAALDAALGYVLDQPAGPLLQSLCAAGWVQNVVQAGVMDDGDLFRLTASGRDRSLHLLAAAKAIEAGLIGRLGEEDGLLLKTLLHRLILATNPGLPDLWPALEKTA